MSDLISRSAFEKFIKEKYKDGESTDDIKDQMLFDLGYQPTAYDLDKVVKRLEEELIQADKEKERCARENPLQFDSAKGYANGVSTSIEIVKGGTDEYN